MEQRLSYRLGIRIGVRLEGDEILNARVVTNTSIENILTGNITSLEKLIPHLANVNLSRTKGN